MHLHIFPEPNLWRILIVNDTTLFIKFPNFKFRFFNHVTWGTIPNLLGVEYCLYHIDT